MKRGQQRKNPAVILQELVGRARDQSRVERYPGVGIVEGDHAFDPGLVVTGRMNLLDETLRHRVAGIVFAASKSPTGHSDFGVAELRDVAETIELRQCALRVDDDRAD